MTALRTLIFGNWPLKLAALGLATVLYAGVALSDGTRTWPGPVTIEVLNAPVGGSLLETPGVVDEIVYQAPQELANQLTADSFRASIDLSNVMPRVGAEPVPVPVDVAPVDPRVRVIDHSPRSVNVRLDEVVTRRIPVTVDPGLVPEGIQLGPVIVEPKSASLTGASSRVGNVRSVEGRIPIDASGINIDQDVALAALDELGALVPGLEIDPPSVRVTIDVARQLAYATLPVVPQLTGEPARGRRVERVSVQPTTITVSGEDGQVRQLGSVSTETVDISGQGGELVVEVPLELPDEVTAPAGSLATVTVTFTDATGSRRLELGTALVGASADHTYQLQDDIVDIVIAGPLSLLDELAPEQLIARIPVAGLDVGEHRIAPVLQVPPGLTIAGTDPETVGVSVGSPT